MARRLTKVPSSPSPWGEEFFLILKEKAKSQLPRSGSSPASEKFKGIFDSNKSLRRRVGHFSDVEEEFFHAVEFGDIPSVERILEERPDLDVSRQDLLGRTPLRLAVANEHLEVVELLLEKTPSDALYEALLIAIVMGHEQIAEVILKSSAYEEPSKDWRQCWSQESDDSPFSSDITPLILASQYNRYEVVQLLLMKGHRIDKPHQYHCTCNCCKEKLEFDRLRFWKHRLEVYRGLSSEAYISLASRDPIYTAFELGRELRMVSTIEKHYKREYLELADNLSDYVVKLLDRVRGNAELETVLNKSKYRKGRVLGDDEGYETMARLRMAIEFEEKKFVAHPTCQQKLISTWYGDLGAYLERPKWFLRLPVMCAIVLMYPFLAMIYLVCPYSKVGRIVRTPCIKLIAQTTFFIVFLVLVLVSSLTEMPSSDTTMQEYGLCFTNHQVPYVPENFYIRAHRPELVYILIILFVLGLCYQECEQLYHEGVHMYFSSFYNLMDSVMMAGYIASFALKIYSFYRVDSALKYFQRPGDPNASCAELSDSRGKEMYYWLNADRLYWDNIDPYILSEILFAFSNVFSFSRISSLLPANEHFGPMQISLARMIKDIGKFMFIFVMVFFAFLVGMVNIYWYYVKRTREQVEIPKHNFDDVTAEGNFGDVISTFRTMYWGMLGMGEIDVVLLGSYNKTFTQDAGYILYGVFTALMVIVLFNMLIAMMTRSFEMIHRDSDMEWKFARSQLYMDYITKGNTLPAPFNIIPSPYAIYKVIRRCFHNSCCHRQEKEDENIEIGSKPSVPMAMFENTPSFGGRENRDMDNGLIAGNDLPSVGTYRPLEGQRNSGAHVDDESAQQPPLPVCGDTTDERQDFRYLSVTTKRYQNVMKGIIKRHIFKSEYEDMSTGVTLDELKQDISSFRFEILNSLRPDEGPRKGNHLLARRMQILESAVDNTRVSLEFMHDKLNTLLLRQAKQTGEVTESLEALVSEPAKTVSSQRNTKWGKVRSHVLGDNNEYHETIPEDDHVDGDEEDGANSQGMFYLADVNENDTVQAKREKKRLRFSDASDTNSKSKEAYV